MIISWKRNAVFPLVISGKIFLITGGTEYKGAWIGYDYILQTTCPISFNQDYL